jgi:hypothetical protein
MTDDQLEAALRDLGTRIDMPETPDVAAAVRTRIGQRSRPHLRPVLTTILAILLAFAVALAVSPQVRAGVAEFLRFAGIEFRSDPPPPLPTTTVPLPGERVVSLAEARAQAGFELHVLQALGQPKEVHLGDKVVSLLYDNVRVDEFDGTISPIMGKFVERDNMEQTTVNGFEAIWVAAPHEVIYVDRLGSTRTETARMSARTLIWQVGQTTLRLEGELTKEQALAIANAG